MNVSMERERRQLALMLGRISKFRDLEALLYELARAQALDGLVGLVTDRRV